MKNVQIFDPAQCCSSGVCDAEADQQLAGVAADLDWAKQQGLAVERYNLAQQPQVFADNALVKAFLERAGADALPLVLLDGKVALEGRYPSRAELERWSNYKGKLTPLPASECCSGGNCC